MGGVVAKAGAGMGGVLGRVNPDVWRELAYVSMSSYSFLLPKREEIVDRGDDGKLPVILIHGMGGNRGAWSPLRIFLRLHGHKRIYAFGYEEGGVEEIAPEFKRFIRSVLKETKAQRVNIVAHSLGGLITRYVIQNMGMSRKVAALITLATPHRGTFAAHWANTVKTLQLRPQSEIIENLNSKNLTRYKIRFIALYSDRDVYVVPAEMMTHPDAENIFIPHISHSQYLLSPEVFRCVAEHLAKIDRDFID